MHPAPVHQGWLQLLRFCSSFAQDRVGRSEVRLIFIGTAPSWLRVYESALQKPTALVKSLAPSSREPGLCEYLDIAEDRPGQSARVYTFWRDTI